MQSREVLPTPARPRLSLDDPRVPERVRWAVERLAVRVLARLAREAATPTAPTSSQERRQRVG